MNTHESLIVRCDCHSLDHIAEFSFWESEQIKTGYYPPALYLTLHMSTWRGFFRRLWLAFCYVIGYSRHGHWDEIDINVEQAKKIVEVCDTFVKAFELYCKELEENKE